MTPNVKDQVLGRDAAAQSSLHLHQHGLGRLLDGRLRREHVLDLRRTDAEGQHPERAVSGSMTIAADDRAAGQRQAEFGSDDVRDALHAAGQPRIRDAEGRHVALQGFDLDLARGVGDRRQPARAILGRQARCGRRPPAWHRVFGRIGRRCADLRTPAGSSPR